MSPVARIGSVAPHWRRRLDFLVMAMIVVSILSFTLETLPDLTDRERTVLWWIELVTVLFFTAEYALRLATAERPLRYATSFNGIVDLVAFLPFWLSLGVDLRAARIFRLLRLLRLLKLFRYVRAMDHLARALKLVKDELLVFGLVACMVIYLAGVGIYYCENPVQPQLFSSIPQALWWAVVTLTTVGYGDIFPVTLLGRCFTFVVLAVGLGIVAIPTGLIATAMNKVREDDRQAEQAGDRRAMGDAYLTALEQARQPAADWDDRTG